MKFDKEFHIGTLPVQTGSIQLCLMQITQIYFTIYLRVIKYPTLHSTLLLHVFKNVYVKIGYYVLYGLHYVGKNV